MHSLLGNSFTLWRPLISSNLCLTNVVRAASRTQRPYLMSLYKRRIKIGPEKERKRSEWSNWSYDAEIFSFGKRLSEDFDNKLLRLSFIHKSYVEKETATRKESLDMDEGSMRMEDNSALINEGGIIISDHVKAFLRTCYPYLLEEYICQVHDHITSTQSLATAAAHIGVRDLILSGEFPPDLETIANTFKALISALQKSENPNRVPKFIYDFLLTQLIDKDINEMYTITDPFKLLRGILRKHDMEPPVPRLLRQIAPETILSCYHVGIYSGKQLLGQSPGETVKIAEREAAKEVLKSFFGTKDNRAVISFLKMDVAVEGQRRNRSIVEFHNDPLE